MLIQKIAQLAKEQGSGERDLSGVIRESLRYGMLLNRSPNALKKEMRRAGMDSKPARMLWFGNHYLLVKLPRLLCTRKGKIPCLQDYLYCRSVLGPDDYQVLNERLSRQAALPCQDEVFHHTFERRARTKIRGARFLEMLDRMYCREDVEQDMAVELVSVMNRESQNFNPTRGDNFTKHVGFCFDSKAKTYLRSSAGKVMMVRNTETFEEEVNLLDRVKQEDPTFVDECPEEYIRVHEDLRRVLPETEYRAVSLLLGFAPQHDKEDFSSFTAEKGVDLVTMTEQSRKRWIEKFLGKPVFAGLRQNQNLREYLTV